MRPLLWLATAVVGSASFLETAPCHPLRLRARCGAAVSVLDPVTSTAALIGFASGAIPTGAIAVRKDQELQESLAREKVLSDELASARSAFGEIMGDLELEAELADAQLSELITMGARKAKKNWAQMSAVNEKFSEQVTKLKELVGDYADRLEFQQSAQQRQTALVQAANSEAKALKERALLLEAKLTRRQHDLEELQDEVSASPSNRFLRFVSGMWPEREREGS